jgi:hypothetical protein
MIRLQNSGVESVGGGGMGKCNVLTRVDNTALKRKNATYIHVIFFSVVKSNLRHNVPKNACQMRDVHE